MQNYLQDIFRNDLLRQGKPLPYGVTIIIVK